MLLPATYYNDIADWARRFYNKKMRLDRFLVQSNICSRREAKQLVKKSRVSVNGTPAKDPSAHINEDSDVVTFDGNPVSYNKFRYYMLNKPQGVVSSTDDGLNSTVIDLISSEDTKDLFPVGRLDKDTEGLLLITNNGKLAHELLSPRHHVDKRYYVETDIKLTPGVMETFRRGVDIGDEKPTLPADIEESGKGYTVTIHEGRYHQIKRMFAALGPKVTFLKRISMGPLTLDGKLEPGQYRPLTGEEIEKLLSN